MPKSCEVCFTKVFIGFFFVSIVSLMFKEGFLVFAVIGTTIILRTRNKSYGTSYITIAAILSGALGHYNHCRLTDLTQHKEGGGL